MYGLLKRHVGHRVALILAGLWYVALLAGVLYCAFEPQAELKYLAL